MDQFFKNSIDSRISMLSVVDEEIIKLRKLIKDKNERFSRLSTSNEVNDILKDCITEIDEGVYILSGRLPDNFMNSLKNDKIIHFDKNDFLWYISDFKKFIKRIEYRVKRNFDVSLQFFYKNVGNYRYENKLESFLKKFDTLSLEIENLEYLERLDPTIPFNKFSQTDVFEYVETEKELSLIQKKYDELYAFFEATKNKNMTPFICQILQTEQIKLLEILADKTEKLKSIKDKYLVL